MAGAPGPTDGSTVYIPPKLLLFGDLLHSLSRNPPSLHGNINARSILHEGIFNPSSNLLGPSETV